MRNASAISTAAVVMGLVATNGFAQNADSGGFHFSSLKSNAFEVRAGYDERVEFEYRHYWFWFVSTDIMAGVGTGGSYDGINLGMSVYPLPFLTAQASAGLAAWKEGGVTDIVSPFRPDYVLKLRGGVFIPIGELDRFYISLTGSRATLVGSSKLVIDSFSFGLGTKF